MAGQEAPERVPDTISDAEYEWFLRQNDCPPPMPLPPDPLGPDEWRYEPDVDEEAAPCAEDEPGPAHLSADDVPGPAGANAEHVPSRAGANAEHVPGAARLSAEELATADPGAELAAALAAIDPRTVDEYELVEMIAASYRLSSWAMSQVTSLAGVLARRPALNPHSPLPGGPETLNVAADEIAPRLGVSRFAARRMVQAADLFRHTLEDTDVALREGRIDYAKALVLVRLLHDQPPDVAWEVQQQVLPDASHQTVTQLERAVSRAIIAVDPHRAAARHRKAREERRVGHPRVLPDGMASIYAVLPATDAAGLDLALEAAARTARAAGDSRTLEQLRADGLALLGHGALERRYIGCPEAVPEAGRPAADDVPAGQPTPAPADGTPVAADNAPDRCGPFPGRGHMPIGTVGGRQAQIQVTVPLSVLLPPEVLSEGGPGPEDWLVRLQGDSSARGPSPACPSSQPRGDDASEHLDYRPTDGDDGPPDGLPPGDDEFEGLADRSADLEDDLPEGWYPGPAPAEVAELHGYGPITPDVAQALAYAGGTWQRLVTDPLSGVLLDVGRTRYRPPAAIADFVRLRDGTCVRPGCSTPAQRCELDHSTAWCEGGTTSTGTLACLCKGDHVIKSSGAFEIHHEGDGSFVWSTPSGHRYRRDHMGRITLLPPASAVEAAQRELATRFGEEPPF